MLTKLYICLMPGTGRSCFLLTGVIWLYLGVSCAQTHGGISIQNGGLEADWQIGFKMAGWGAWGKGATPDVLPGQWSITKAPNEGRSYVGLIIREDGTREGIYQKLETPLKAGTCYYLTLALAHLPDYAGFRLPGCIRILGKNGTGGRPSILAMSQIILHEQWVSYTLEFTPLTTMDQLIIEAAYAPGVTKPYRGNILIDHISSLSPCLRASL